MKNPLKEKDILVAACGVTEDGRPKSQIQIITKFVDLNSKKEHNVDVIELQGPAVSFRRGKKLAAVDIQFDNKSDSDYIKTMKTLNDFHVPQSSLTGQYDIIPVVIVNIIPLSYEGEYYVTGIHNISFQSGISCDKTISFTFESDDFFTCRHTDGKVGIDRLLAMLKVDSEGEFPEITEPKVPFYTKVPTLTIKG